MFDNNIMWFKIDSEDFSPVTYELFHKGTIKAADTFTYMFVEVSIFK